MLGDIIASVIGGGATGILGVAVQRIADFYNKKQDIEIQKAKHAHEQSLRKLDAEIMREEWAQRTKIAEVEAESRIDVADSEAFAKSFNEPQMYSQVKLKGWKQGLMVILDFIRGIIRPGLTLYLCGVTTLIYVQAQKMIGGIDGSQALEVVRMTVQTILYLSSTCVLWYFGTRNRGKPPSM